MATKEELFAAVRLIKEHCSNHGACIQPICELYDFCNDHTILSDEKAPCDWPDPEEGGGEDG